MQTSFPATTMRYLAMLASVTALIVAAAFAFNALVDPLWYFGGNQLKPVNFAFNERLSKVNLIDGHEAEYDCIIFGDSRATLLPEQKIQGHHCFNFAFSAGAVDEFLAYALWLKARGFDPHLVIVGVSAGDFRKRNPPHNIPDFILEGREPTSPFIKYLSTDVVGMSWRTLFGSSPIDRYYNASFQCQIAVTSHYDPKKPIRDVHAGPFDERRPLAQYQALRDVFPEAEFVGYAPPISAYAILDYKNINWLASYTGALVSAAGVFDHFWDASIPSPITIDPANTYDGTHYSSTVNAHIAEGLLTGLEPYAINLKQMTAGEALAAYMARLAQYHDELIAHLN